MQQAELSYTNEVLLWSLIHLIEKEIRKKGGKKGSRSRIEIEQMERTHAAFVGPFLPVSVDKKNHPQ